MVFGGKVAVAKEPFSLLPDQVKWFAERVHRAIYIVYIIQCIR